MFWLVVFILGVVAYVYFSSKSSEQRSSSSSNRTYKSSSSSNPQAQNFLPPIPKGYQIFCQHLEVAGLSFRKEDAMRFFKGSEHTLKLERELNNEHDKNAIKVIGVTSSSKHFLGYVPKEVSEQIISTHLLENIKPRLARIYQGSDGFMEIQFQLIGLKEHKKQYDDFLNNQPADSSQKDFYKFLSLPIPKGLTTAEAAKTMAEIRKNPGTHEFNLKEYEAFNDILDEFDDSDFRASYDLKKVGKTILNEALNQLKQEGKTYEHLSINIDEVVERVIKLKPELEKT